MKGCEVTEVICCACCVFNRTELNSIPPTTCSSSKLTTKQALVSYQCLQFLKTSDTFHNVKTEPKNVETTQQNNQPCRGDRKGDVSLWATTITQMASISHRVSQIWLLQSHDYLGIILYIIILLYYIITQNILPTTWRAPYKERMEMTEMKNKEARNLKCIK